jgi:hypothetical protein
MTNHGDPVSQKSTKYATVMLIGSWSLRQTRRSSSLSGPTPEQWNEWIRGHWRIENASHHDRDVTFAEDASRIRKNPGIAARLRSFADNLHRAAGCENIKNARWRAALDLNLILAMHGLYRELNCPEGDAATISPLRIDPMQDDERKMQSRLVVALKVSKAYKATALGAALSFPVSRKVCNNVS